MSNSSTVDEMPLPWSTISTKVASEDANPATGWMSCAGLKEFRTSWELARLDGDMTVSPGLQFANHPDSPGTVVAELSTFKDTADVYYGPAWKDVSTQAAANQLFRIVWVAKNASTTNLTTARVAGTVSLHWS